MGRDSNLIEAGQSRAERTWSGSIFMELAAPIRWNCFLWWFETVAVIRDEAERHDAFDEVLRVCRRLTPLAPELILEKFRPLASVMGNTQL